MKITRHKTRTVKIGNICIGSGHPIAIQSMVKYKTSDLSRVLGQIHDLKDAGCEIVRLAVKDDTDARSLGIIRKKTDIAIVADIHFDFRLALKAIDSGVDKIRLNPGNIYKKDEIREIAKAAKLAHIPIRVGLNSGSVKRIKDKGSRENGIAGSMVKSALDYIKILEGFKFNNIVVSLKASDTLDTVEAYRRFSKLSDYPLHLGVTATGMPLAGTVKSSVALGILLSQGIGDTIRISLTDIPQEEVRVAKYILTTLGLRSFGPEIISCPTCGRCEVDLVKLVREFEAKLSNARYQLPSKVAIMGCVVNGPGEAKDADFGIAFGSKDGLLFRSGKPLRKISFNHCTESLLQELNKIRAKGEGR